MARKVTIRQVTRRFGGVLAVDRVDFTIGGGELVAVLGPSGCGKTTLLRLVAGLLYPDEGEILADDRRLSWPGDGVPPERRRMAMIFQSYAVWPHMTVFQNVAYGLGLRNVSRAEIGRRVREILRVVHLGHVEGRYPAELSGGQQQRVALARALVVEPEILLLDEPLSNLDANLREEMRFEIRRLHDQFGITTIYVTHDQAEAMVTSDRIAVICDGRLVQLGTPEEVYERPATEFVATFVGKTNILEGILVDATSIEVAQERRTLRLAPQENGGRGARAKVCFRPHDVQILGPPGSLPPETNLLDGRLVRHTYLGDTRDYVVALDGGTLLRVTADPSCVVPIGERVRLAIPSAKCHLLAPEG
jgi:iron(III) transport system ATP-binding protein